MGFEAPQGADTTGSPSPLVSIGLPLYNSAGQLRKAMDALLGQTLGDFELVISDNASTDATADICLEYARTDGRIRYIRQDVNIGAPRNWNAVFHVARGRYFKWASGNDVCEPTLLERCVEALEDAPDAVLCYGRTLLVDDRDQPIELYRGDQAVTHASPSRRFDHVLRTWDLNNAQQGVIRSDVLRRSGLDRAFPAGDVALMAELALYGRFILLPDVLLHRSYALGSVMAQRGPDEVQRIYFPQATQQMQLVAWRHQWDHFRSVARAPIAPTEKLRGWAVSARWMVAARRYLVKEAVALVLPAVPMPPGESDAPPVHVGLLGMYRAANLGDTAIQAGVMDGLRERLGQVTFTGICADPEDTAETHGISAAQWWGEGPVVGADGSILTPAGTQARSRIVRYASLPGRRLSGIDRVVKELDLLVVSGSGQIDDYWGGPFSQPFRLLLWTMAARRRRIPVAVMGVGVDELSTKLGARFSVWALRLARFRAFRDSGTVEILRRLGLDAPSSVCPDPAFGLEPPSPADADASSSSVVPSVVVSPISRAAWPGPEDAVYDAYLEALRLTVEQLAGEGVGVRFTCSQRIMDVPVAERIRDRLSPTTASRCQIDVVSQPEEFMVVTASVNVVVATRLHAVVLALVSGTPVVAIAESRKVRQLMNDLELSEYFVELDRVSAPVVVDLVRRALTQESELRQHIDAQRTALRRSLAATYDELVVAVSANARARGVRSAQSMESPPVSDGYGA